MKELLRKFEDLWITVTFAEAGEYEASREFLDHDGRAEEGAGICTAA